MRVRSVVGLLLAICVVAATAGATSCFVAATGTDGNNNKCTETDPCQTLSGAVSSCCSSGPQLCAITIVGLTPVRLSNDTTDVSLPNGTTVTGTATGGTLSCLSFPVLRFTRATMAFVTFNGCMIQTQHDYVGAELALQSCAFVQSALILRDVNSVSIDMCNFTAHSNVDIRNALHSVMISDSIFAHSMNGAVSIRNSPQVIVEHSVFRLNEYREFNNSDDGRNGLLHMQEVADARVTNCSFAQSSAPSGAGLALVACTRAALIGCSFMECAGESRLTVTTGGALYASQSAVYVRGCVFAYNIASEGGAISVLNSALHVSNSSFSNNTAVRGGAVWIASQAPITFNESTVFANNIALRYGSVVYATESQLVLNDTTLLYNNATGIESFTCVVTMNRCSVTGQYGIVLVARGGIVGIAASAFTLNFGDLGGVLALYEGSAVINDTQFVVRFCSLVRARMRVCACILSH